MAMVIIKQSLIMMVIITGHLIIDISANSAELSRPFTRPQRDVVLAPKFWSLCLLWGNPNTWQIQIDQKYKYMKYKCMKNTNRWKYQDLCNHGSPPLHPSLFSIETVQHAPWGHHLYKYKQWRGWWWLYAISFLSYNNIFKYRMIIIYTIFCLTSPEPTWMYEKIASLPFPEKNVYTGTLFIENVQMRIW